MAGIPFLSGQEISKERKTAHCTQPSESLMMSSKQLIGLLITNSDDPKTSSLPKGRVEESSMKRRALHRIDRSI